MTHCISPQPQDAKGTDTSNYGLSLGFRNMTRQGKGSAVVALPIVCISWWQLRFALSGLRELKFGPWIGGSCSREVPCPALGSLTQEGPWATLQGDFPLGLCFLCKNTSTQNEPQR